MSRLPLRVAIEGPCCAGKTTLGRGLEQELQPLRTAYIMDYYEYTRGGGFFPRPIPGSAAEAEDALRWLLNVEERRTAQARAAENQLDVILIDRSIHTLLAHRYALKKVGKFNDFQSAQDLIDSSVIPLWPDVIMYLDMPQNLVHQRNNGKFEPDNIFIDADFNQGIRTYFQRFAGVPHHRIAWLDAANSIVMIRAIVNMHIGSLVSQLDNEKEVR